MRTSPGPADWLCPFRSSLTAALFRTWMQGPLLPFRIRTQIKVRINSISDDTNRLSSAPDHAAAASAFPSSRGPAILVLPVGAGRIGWENAKTHSSSGWTRHSSLSRPAAMIHLFSPQIFTFSTKLTFHPDPLAFPHLTDYYSENNPNLS